MRQSWETSTLNVWIILRYSDSGDWLPEGLIVWGSLRSGCVCVPPCVRASVRVCVRPCVRACHFFLDHFWSAKTQIPLGKRSKKGPENGPFLHIVSKDFNYSSSTYEYYNWDDDWKYYVISVIWVRVCTTLLPHTFWIKTTRCTWRPSGVPALQDKSSTSRILMNQRSVLIIRGISTKKPPSFFQVLC